MATLSSLLFNCLLLAATLHLAVQPPIQDFEKKYSVRFNHRKIRVQNAIPTTPAANPAPENAHLDSPPASMPFCWAQIESADYRMYRSNLQAIGCPEETIRDIITADVNDLFSEHVKALVDEVTGNFWEWIRAKNAFEKMVNEKHDQLRELKTRRDETIKILFEDKPEIDQERQNQ